jgi:hypothetical protein
MRSLLSGLAVLALAAAAGAADEGKGKEAGPRTVVVPQDSTPFSVQRGDVVRLSGTGIAGSRIEAEVEGPARLVATNAVSVRRQGKPLLGSANREFEVRATGEGKVTVTLTSTPPQPAARPTVTKYEFDVK